MPGSVTSQRKDGLVAKSVSILFSLFFLLNAIDSPIPGISIGELVLAMAAVLSFLNGAGWILKISSVHRDMLALALMCLIVTLTTFCFQPVFSVKDFAVRSVRWFFYIGCAIVLGERVNPKQLRSTLFVVAVAASIFLIVQVLVYRLLGEIITLQIGKQILGCTVENIYLSGKLAGRIVRFSSFFSEPAHFSYYVILAVAVELLCCESARFSPRTLVGVGIVFFALICCTSTYAILLTVILMLSFLLLFYKYHGMSRQVIIWTVVLLSIGIVLVLIFAKSIFGDYLFKKISSIGDTSRTSFIWEQDGLFLTLQRCFGVGIGNEKKYYSYETNGDLEYVNSISLIFLYCGFVGLIMMLLFFIKAWIESCNQARVIILLFAAASLYSTAFFSTVMVLYTVAIAAGERMPVWCGSEEVKKFG